MSQTGSPLYTPSGPHSYPSGDTVWTCAAFTRVASSMESVVTPATVAAAPRMGSRPAFVAAATAVAATSDWNDASSSSSSSSTLAPVC